MVKIAQPTRSFNRNSVPRIPPEMRPLRPVQHLAQATIRHVLIQEQIRIRIAAIASARAIIPIGFNRLSITARAREWPISGGISPEIRFILAESFRISPVTSTACAKEVKLAISEGKLPVRLLEEICSLSTSASSSTPEADDEEGANDVGRTLWSKQILYKNNIRLAVDGAYAFGFGAMGRFAFVKPISLDQLCFIRSSLCLDIILFLLNPFFSLAKLKLKTLLKGNRVSRHCDQLNLKSLQKMLASSSTRPRSPLESPLCCSVGVSCCSKDVKSSCLAQWNLLHQKMAAHWLHVTAGTDAFPCEAPTFNVDHGNIAFLVGHGTKVHLNSSLLSEKQVPVEDGSSSMELEFGDTRDKEACQIPKLGGLSEEFDMLKDIIISLSEKDSQSSFGSLTVKGVLLHGPSGTGKTSLALSCVNDAGVNLFSVKGPELISSLLGESEQSLHEVFDSASQAAPAVVFIDELDAIAPARKDGSEELSQRMVATLLTLMDGIDSSDGILVIAATNRPNSIDPALRRPGRFDKEIEIGVPSTNQRLDILKVLLTDMVHSLVDSQVQHLASSMHGFVGADIAALCNEAALVCLRRYINLKKTSISSSGTEDEVSVSPSSTCVDASSKAVKSFQFDPEYQHKIDSSFPTAQCNCDFVVSRVGEEDFLEVSFDDFEKAKMSVKPSAMREIMLEVPKVRWEDVGGQKEIKMQLVEAVEWPQKHHDVFTRYGIRPPTGVLLFGPPGCSKTLMARAVASEAGLNFFAVKGPELFSKWVGESEKAVRSLFAKARDNAPSVIFFDELDGFAIVRGKESEGASVGDRVMSQLLVELDGLHQRVNVTVIAATNRPDKIDSALLRPGRFDRLLYVGPPNESDRVDIFRIHTRKMPCGSDVNLKELAHLTEGCTGADISLICREAALAAMEESLDVAQISMAHFKIGLTRVQPSDIHSYHEFSTKFQRLVLNGAGKDDEECQPTRGLSIRSWLKSLFGTVAMSKASS
ncbi:hypothetical protein Syun_005412 [Stephania yunnanensis]|uniref:AAA+ ATPase domain-containing protein n=1 Tax=Stephania yunnanensis TaxID=152371 RepID=A0AAP0L5P1_9MAGN